MHQVQQHVARQSLQPGQSYGKGNQQLGAQQQLNNQMIGGNPSPQMNRLPHPPMSNQSQPQQWNYQTPPTRFNNRSIGKDFQTQMQQQPDNKPSMMMNNQSQMQPMQIRQQMQTQQQILVTGGPQMPVSKAAGNHPQMQPQSV